MSTYGFSIAVFFFSSSRRHTSWPRDWSSDVCFPIYSQLLPVLGHGAPGQSDAALGQPVGQRLIGEGFFGRFLADQIAQPGLDRGGRYLLAVSAVNAGGKEILELENAARGVNVFFGGGARDG